MSANAFKSWPLQKRVRTKIQRERESNGSGREANKVSGTKSSWPK